jgi:hypothetical protein
LPPCRPVSALCYRLIHTGVFWPLISVFLRRRHGPERLARQAGRRAPYRYPCERWCPSDRPTAAGRPQSRSWVCGPFGGCGPRPGWARSCEHVLRLEASVELHRAAAAGWSMSPRHLQHQRTDRLPSARPSRTAPRGRPPLLDQVGVPAQQDPPVPADYAGLLFVTADASASIIETRKSATLL